MRVQKAVLSAIFFVASFAAIGASAAPAWASDWIQITGCDSVLIQGAYHPRMTFSVHNAYPYPFSPIYTFRMVSDGWQSTVDTCAAITAFAPLGWREVHEGSIGGLSSLVFVDTTVVADTLGNIWQGETQAGFQIVLNRAHGCCFTIYFYGAFFDPFAQDHICFDCDLPVATRPASWGSLKARYR